MSNQWKAVIGVVVGILILCLVAGTGFVVGRTSSFAAMNRPGLAMPNPRGFDRPDQFEGRANPPANRPQLEVQLIDDDEDGIPDRGLAEFPARPDLNREFDGRFNDRVGPPQNFGRGLNPTRSPFNRLPFFPFGPLAGLLCLTALAGLVVLGVVLYRQRPSTPPSSPTTSTNPPSAVSPSTSDTPETIEPEPSDLTPVEVEPDEAASPDEVESTPEDSEEAPESDDDEAESDTSPEEKRPDS